MAIDDLKVARALIEPHLRLAEYKARVFGKLIAISVAAGFALAAAIIWISGTV